MNSSRKWEHHGFRTIVFGGAYVGRRLPDLDASGALVMRQVPSGMQFIILDEALQ